MNGELLLMLAPAYSNGIKVFLNSHLKFDPQYRGSPTYTVFTTVDPTRAVIGFCMRNWVFLALVRDPRKFHVTRAVNNILAPAAVASVKILMHCKSLLHYKLLLF